MPDITAETPRSTITIAGQTFKIPEPYGEGHSLNANEASTLNQTYAENIRNNMFNKIEEAVEASKKDGGAPLDMTALQQLVDDYTADYEFGQRRGGSSGDPVERAALDDARDLVRSKIREKGLKLSDYKSADITEKAKAVLEKYPQIREQAAARVKAQQEAAASLSADIEV